MPRDSGGRGYVIRYEGGGQVPDELGNQWFILPAEAERAIRRFKARRGK